MPMTVNWGWLTIGEAIKDPHPGPLPYPSQSKPIVRKPSAE